MATAKILTLCDTLVTEIDTAWTQGASDTISRRYIAPVNLGELSSLTGRHVYVFPGAYDNSPDTRGHDAWVHEVRIVVVERYETAGSDPAGTTIKAWVDDRVDFVETKIVETLDYDGRSTLRIGSTREFTTESVEIEVYDPELLNQKDLFVSTVDLVFREYAIG